MSFAVRTDGEYRCRRVSGPEEVLPNEVFSDTYVALTGLQADVADERLWRDSVLESVKWLRERHRDQLDLGKGTSLSAEQFNELLAYMQSLRDWPQAPTFPDANHRPTPPNWIAGFQP